jgi:enamine deaminase RidA (YjgF/YER057c/UK114 family)
MTKRQAVFPAGRQALYDKYKYSAAIRSGDLLFVSGQVGSREDGTPEPDLNVRSSLRSKT